MFCTDTLLDDGLGYNTLDVSMLFSAFPHDIHHIQWLMVDLLTQV